MPFEKCGLEIRCALITDEWTAWKMRCALMNSGHLMTASQLRNKKACSFAFTEGLLLARSYAQKARPQEFPALELCFAALRSADQGGVPVCH